MEILSLNGIEYLVATTVSDGAGKYHPAVQNGHHVYYWANRKFDEEDTAWAAARDALADALAALNAVVGAWNLTSLT